MNLLSNNTFFVCPCFAKSLISRGRETEVLSSQHAVRQIDVKCHAARTHINLLSLSHIDKLICVSLEMRNLHLDNNEIGDAGGVLGLTVTLRQ